MKASPRPAFTLIEMIIAITIFTIFIGFSISSYLTFHRADQEALVTRTLIMSAQSMMSSLSDSIRESAIAYDEYSAVSGSNGLDLGVFDFDGLSVTDAINTHELHLWSADGLVRTVYFWDSEAQTLSMQSFDVDGKALDEAVLLHSDALRVSYANFRIFPSQNPYEYRTEDELQYQPFVTVNLTFSMPGRVREELTFDLRTSVTTRFYQ